MSALRKRRTMGEMALFALLMVAVAALLALAACEQDETPAVTVGLSPEQRAEIVGRWYGEIYPQFVAPRR